MVTIRELFHKIGNGHNKISVGAGVTKELLKRKSKDTNLEEMKDTLIKKLSELEQHAIETDKVVNQLKDIIYRIVDPDRGKIRK